MYIDCLCYWLTVDKRNTFVLNNIIYTHIWESMNGLVCSSKSLTNLKMNSFFFQSLLYVKVFFFIPFPKNLLVFIWKTVYEKNWNTKVLISDCQYNCNEISESQRVPIIVWSKSYVVASHSSPGQISFLVEVFSVVFNIRKFRLHLFPDTIWPS